MFAKRRLAWPLRCARIGFVALVLAASPATDALAQGSGGQAGSDSRSERESDILSSALVGFLQGGSEVGAYAAFEAGGVYEDNDANDAGSNAGVPFGQASGSKNTNSTTIGADIKIPLVAFTRGAVRAEDRFIPLGLFIGQRVRIFLNKDDQIVSASFHPTAGDDTRLSMQDYWAAKTYLGMAALLRNPGSRDFAVRIAPYVGINIQRRSVTFSTDESGGGGTLNTTELTKTLVGPAAGIDFDFLFANTPFFIGVGLQFDWLGGISGNMTSTTGRQYSFNTGNSVAFSAFVRLGYNFGGPPPGAVYASDAWLKRDVALVERRPDGIGLYRYRYHWSDTEYVGVMAQEVANIVPEAVVRGPDGFLRVNYGKLGLDLKTWDAWRTSRS